VNGGAGERCTLRSAHAAARAGWARARRAGARSQSAAPQCQTSFHADITFWTGDDVLGGVALRCAPRSGCAARVPDDAVYNATNYFVSTNAQHDAARACAKGVLCDGACGAAVAFCRARSWCIVTLTQFNIFVRGVMGGRRAWGGRGRHTCDRQPRPLITLHPAVTPPAMDMAAAAMSPCATSATLVPALVRRRRGCVGVLGLACMRC
jgi:hypothetical protein